LIHSDPGRTDELVAADYFIAGIAVVQAQGKASLGRCHLSFGAAAVRITEQT